MARVVTRRSGQPYLLVVFVFLFVIAAALAVVFYVKASRKTQELAAKTGQVADVRGEAVELQEKLDELAMLVTGKSGDGYEDAKTSTKNTYEDETVVAVTNGQQGGLAPELTRAAQAVIREETARKAAQAATDTVRAEAAAAERTLRTQIETLTKDIEDRDKRLAAQTSQQGELAKKYDKHIESVDQQLKDVRATFEKRQADLESKIEELVKERTGHLQTIADLREEIAGYKGPGTDSVRIDGRIVRVVEPSDLAYISIGRKAGLKPGVTFAVFPADDTSKRKASLRVVQVGDDWSETKVTSRDTEAGTLAAGDVISNIAYDPTRTYTFVVEGLFDLDNDGQVTARERKEILDAIERFGGEIADELSYKADYLVIGDPPAKPSEPNADAPLAVHRTYQEALKRYQDFQQLTSLARDFNVKILNTNRFLDLTGYMPEKLPR